jgi:intraflagellar transport protein 20
MAENSLLRAGLYIDDLNRIRILDPELSEKTNELKTECSDFTESK